MKAIVAAIVFGFLPTIVRSAIEADLVTEVCVYGGSDSGDTRVFTSRIWSVSMLPRILLLIDILTYICTQLPGWEGGALPSKHYSGYISV
jgi:hypothetical protein